jgi:hypothetical protein
MLTLGTSSFVIEYGMDLVHVFKDSSLKQARLVKPFRQYNHGGATSTHFKMGICSHSMAGSSAVRLVLWHALIMPYNRTLNLMSNFDIM